MIRGIKGKKGDKPFLNIPSDAIQYPSVLCQLIGFNTDNSLIWKTGYDDSDGFIVLFKIKKPEPKSRVLFVGN